jgi:hypothetical protein
MTTNIGMRPAPVKISDGPAEVVQNNFLDYPSDFNALNHNWSLRHV